MLTLCSHCCTCCAHIVLTLCSHCCAPCAHTVLTLLRSLHTLLLCTIPIQLRCPGTLSAGMVATLSPSGTKIVGLGVSLSLCVLERVTPGEGSG